MRSYAFRKGKLHVCNAKKRRSVNLEGDLFDLAATRARNYKQFCPSKRGCGTSESRQSQILKKLAFGFAIGQVTSFGQ